MKDEYADDSSEYVNYDSLAEVVKSEHLAFDSARNAIYDSLRNEYYSEKWYLMAAEQGLPEAQSALGGFYEFGHGRLPKGDRDAKYWFEKAALQNNAYAQSSLSNIYAFQFPGPVNLVRAHFWLRLYIENNPNFVERARVRLLDLQKSMTEEQLQEAQLLFEKEKDQILNQNQK
ncbi:MAG: sel1 repeat family protein [candidate division Zixibacteria bacterium]|nr:sel1 repeat family protein [candidate division Zixibacteria bacterium]